MNRAKNMTAAVFVDVDGTLITWERRRGKLRARPNLKLIERIRAAQRGEQIDFVLWSRRGRIYARAMAGRLGVLDLFCAIVGKPTAIIDDEGLAWLKGVRVNPGEMGDPAQLDKIPAKPAKNKPQTSQMGAKECARVLPGGEPWG